MEAIDGAVEDRDKGSSVAEAAKQILVEMAKDWRWLHDPLPGHTVGTGSPDHQTER